MIELNIPGRDAIQLDHLVCDVNGTLAEDGNLLSGLARTLQQLSDRLAIHLLTADTHGGQDQIDQLLNMTAVRLDKGNESEQKAAYVRDLGSERVIAIGQGANDLEMLKEAALGICVLSREGAATTSLAAADIIVPDIFAALGLLEKPMRIVATLRK
ncbi:MAG: HAD hydrolase family protein [Anaerolineaceae bacterium]|nr:HAD hydrolase family protein [Anaerolineaceae bacterium]